MRKLSALLPIFAILVLAAFLVRGFLNRGEYDIAAGQAHDEAAAFTDGRPNLVAATFYSAWCSSCAILEPRLRQIAPEFEGRAVEFAKFDFSLGQPESLTEKARALGVESVYAANKGATGFMALIDRRTQKVMAILTLRLSDQDIRRSIEEGIKEASRPAV